MPASANTKAVNTLYAAIYGITPGNVTFVTESNAAALDLRAYANTKVATVAAGGPSNAALATTVLTNMGINTPELNTALVGIFAVNANDRGVVIAQLGMLLESIGNNAPGTTVEQTTLFGAAANAWNAGLATAYTYSSNAANTIATPWSVGNTIFNMADSTVAGVKSMVLTGNQDVRIDMTNMLNQITGLDLNGDGVISNNGMENSATVKAASGYIAVDAYTRLVNGVVNETDLSKVFLGDIKYDGTGFKGDGVNTNGNVVLGGLGADTILGGIGNDFLAGGGVALSRPAGGVDTLSGGRNADFFFTELSLLSNTDGNKLVLDGGITADDNSAGNTNSAQDTDWLLLQASDDDEPVSVVLEDHMVDGDGNGNFNDEGVLTTRAGQQATMRDVENVDASGNTYGFIKGLSTTIGGAPVNANNDGIGSSAQLRITTEATSTAANIIIGGYDNDSIDAGGGNDIVMGGNLNKLIDPNLVGIVGNNDGRDELIGGGGVDNIAFEADGGVIEGGATVDVNDADIDTLWLTANSLGATKAAGAAVVPVAATALTTDNTLRFDLADGKVGGLDNAAGYGGANAGGTATGYTADQTNYTAASAGLRVQVQDMENVIATGLGAIDFKAAGANTANDLTFSNQQNFLGYAGNLTLRGEAGANTLYASNGTDVLEGRAGNDKLSGGNGDDDFVFFLQAATGDGVDVIHRQADLNGDNLWDGYSDSTGAGTFVQDFGQKSAAITANSKLTLTLTDTAHPADLSGFPVNGVAFKLDGVSYTVGLTSGVQGTYAAFTAGLNAALDANPALAALDAVLNANNTITITDPAGKAFVSVGYTFVGNVVPPAGTLTWNQAIGDPSSTQTLDRLIYRSYEDRLDNELINDDAITGSLISLGVDAYAQDLVVNFAADGTRLAEDQSYTVVFKNLTTQDKVTVAVNGVTYTLQVGVDLDGNSIAGEDDAVTTNQVTIQSNFVTRLDGFINSFMDNDTAAGQVGSTTNNVDTLTLTQVVYNAEQTVFMTTPVVTIQQLSAGEAATAVVANTSQHEVLLYNFDGRNLDGAGTNLDSTNVLFVGDTMVNQSTLQTANNLTGGTITGKNAVVVDGGANDLAGIANNTATNSALATNFSIHGDDFIMGGAGVDTINTGTGDDRVQGSRGADALDGGKNYYAVKVLGEAEARVITWNVWEAANKTSAQSLASALLSSPGLTLDMLTSSTVTLIDQSQSGIATASGLFDDTLIYAQGDFVTGSTRFTVALNNFTVDAGVVNLRNGGAGTVTVDLTGNGATADDSTSTFTNFENIRTVSGTGNAVAGVGGGQGNDTLDVSLLSTATGGISYDLTTAGTQGQVKYSANAHASLTKPAAADFESLVIKVDGVESVIGGTGDDLVSIDQSEAGKDNSFTGSLGDDRIIYSSAYVGDVGGVAEPTVTIKVNTSADVDQVLMTAGRVGSVVATDTLNSVEFISLTTGTATGSREDDVLDVRAMTTGAVVSYIDGTVKDLAGVTQVTIDGIAQIENVIADGDDTVIVASAAIMGANTRADAVVAQKDLSLATFLDYDEIVNATGVRATFSSLAAGAGVGAGQIENYINEREFTFNLGTVGTDTVDYSQSTDAISARVELDVTQANQYVLADSSGGAFDATIALGDRLDVLTSVEKIVAAQGESVLDLTTSTKGLEVKYNLAAVADKVANSAVFNAYDVNSVRISDITSASPLTRSYLEYRDASDVAQAAPAVNKATATWSRVEGSDFAERIILNSAHSTDNNTFNLRGGANEVKYNELTRSITTTLSLVDYDAAAPFGTVATGYAGLYASTNAASVNQQNGTVMAITQFQDGNSVALATGGTHVATSYTANNGISTGASLRIAASQDAEDTLAVAGLSSKVFLLSETGTTDNQITVKLGSGAAANSVILTGYEFLQDAASNDVYDMGALAATKAALTFTDSTADHDAIKVANDAVTFNGAAANTIDLNTISATVGGFNMDFDVLDITKVTSSNLILTGGTDAAPANADVDGSDEVVLGALAKVASMTSFESVVLTDASVAAGSAFTFNAATNSLTQGATTITTSGTSLSFGGLMLESVGGLGNSYVADVATAVTVTVAGGTGATVRGGSAADTITGAGGNDTLYGNGGADILDGGTAAEVRTVQFSGIMSGTAEAVITMTFGTGGSVLTLNEVAAVVDVDATDGTLDILAGAGSIAVATAFQSLVNARLANINAVVDAFDTGVAGAADDAKIVSVSRAADLLTFTFTSGIDAQAADSIATAFGVADLAVTTLAFSTDTTITNGGNGGSDTFVFEKTAALNGADTVNGFVSGALVGGGDVLKVSAFMGGVPTLFTGNYAAWAGDANGWVGVLFNKASLSATDITLAKLGNDGKAVILVTADADGAVDATNNGYSMYYVEDTLVGAGQNYVVTLVGTINSTTELANASFIAANFA